MRQKSAPLSQSLQIRDSRGDDISCRAILYRSLYLSGYLPVITTRTDTTPLPIYSLALKVPLTMPRDPLIGLVGKPSSGMPWPRTAVR
jgi:hypothetical protein